MPRGVSSADRVVHRPLDLAVVEEEGVAERREPRARVLVVLQQGVVGVVRARHHERAETLREEEVLDRGVGEHDAEAVAARRDRRRSRPPRPGAAPARSGRAGETRRRLRRGGQRHQPPRRREVRDHHGERLVVASLPAPQPPRRPPRSRVDDQVVAAEPLHGQDAALPQQRPPRGESDSPDTLAGRVDQPHARAAAGAAGRLGVEASVARDPVLRLARRAHGEGRHGGEGPVVGEVLDDRVARSAVRAVDERVAVAAVGRIPDLAQAVVAGRRVDGDATALGRRVIARTIEKVVSPTRRRLLRPQDHLGRRRPAPAPRRRARPRTRRADPAALDVDRHARRVVSHGAREAELAREPPDERAEAHALHLPRRARCVERTEGEGGTPSEPTGPSKRSARGGVSCAHRSRPAGRAARLVQGEPLGGPPPRRRRPRRRRDVARRAAATASSKRPASAYAAASTSSGRGHLGRGPLAGRLVGQLHRPRAVADVASACVASCHARARREGRRPRPAPRRAPGGARRPRPSASSRRMLPMLRWATASPVSRATARRTPRARPGVCLARAGRSPGSSTPCRSPGTARRRVRSARSPVPAWRACASPVPCCCGRTDSRGSARARSGSDAAPRRGSPALRGPNPARSMRRRPSPVHARWRARGAPRPRRSGTPPARPCRGRRGRG